MANMTMDGHHGSPPLANVSKEFNRIHLSFKYLLKILKIGLFKLLNENQQLKSMLATEPNKEPTRHQTQQVHQTSVSLPFSYLNGPLNHSTRLTDRTNNDYDSNKVVCCTTTTEFDGLNNQRMHMSSKRAKVAAVKQTEANQNSILKEEFRSVDALNRRSSSATTTKRDRYRLKRQNAENNDVHNSFDNGPYER